MDEKDKMSRTVEAVRRIYAIKGIDLSEDQGLAIASRLGNRPARAAILCGVFILALVAFLIARFAL
jgi:hypothetical protein